MVLSLPVRGAWIEIETKRIICGKTQKSLPVRGAWIEMISVAGSGNVEKSLPVRGAWIKITVNLTW